MSSEQSVTQWSGQHADVSYRINHFSIPDYNDNCWTYYVFIHEQKIGTEKFEKLWLPDEIVKFGQNSPERITHEYYKVREFDELDLHQDITYYVKHGHTPGFRCVEVGCDYQHLTDSEAGYPNDLESVRCDAFKSCEVVKSWFLPVTTSATV